MNISESVVEFKKVYAHPDKDEIIEKLISGESVRQVEAWLKQKYPIAKKRHISFVTLQKFRSQCLDLEADVLKDLQKQRKELEIQKKFDQRQEYIKQGVTYQAQMANYVQSSLIDYNNTITTLLNQCYTGIEKLKDIDDQRGSHHNHQAIVAYLSKLQDLMVMHDKMIKDQEKKASGKLEADYETLKKQLDILRDVIKEVFLETNPEGLPIFTSRVRERMIQAGLIS